MRNTLLIAGIVLSLAACKRDDTHQRQTSEVRDDNTSDQTTTSDSTTINQLQMDGSYISYATDPETGCQYVLLYQSGITPRLESDGKTVKGCTTNGH